MAPLHYSVIAENIEVLERLLSGGADPNARNGRGDSPLHFAAWKSANPKVAEVLLSAGADPILRRKNGETPLDIARKYNLDVLEILLAPPVLSRKGSEGADPESFSR